MEIITNEHKGNTFDTISSEPMAPILDKPKAFKAVYDVTLVGMSKRQQNILIDRAERLLKVAIPKYITLGKAKYPHKFEIYYTTHDNNALEN